MPPTLALAPDLAEPGRVAQCATNHLCVILCLLLGHTGLFPAI